MNTEDLIISSYAYLYRDWADYPFPCRNQEGSADILVRAAETLLAMKWHRAEDLNPMEREDKICRGLLPRSFFRNMENTGYGEDGKFTTILINDVEHISIRVNRRGQNLDKCVDTAYYYEGRLGAAYPYAYHEELGFCFSVPFRLGEGLDLGLILHLPHLREMTEKELPASAREAKLVFEPLFPEEQEGALYRLQSLPEPTTSIETKEQALLEKAGKFCEMEVGLAKLEWHQKETSVLDRLWRSYATLSYARRLEKKEFLSLWSSLREGAILGVLPVTLKKTENLLPLGLYDRLAPEVRANFIRDEIKKGRKSTICQSSEDSLQSPKKL